MNVLQILPALDIGGVETGTVDLAKYLIAHGHKAITVSSGGRLVRELDAIGARHYNLPVDRKSPLCILRMVGALRDIIRREDIDIVHARSRVPALIAYFACKAANRVLITTAHGYYRKHISSSVMGWGKVVIVASNAMAKHMISNFGVPRDRVRLIPRGVDLRRFKFTDPADRSSKEFTLGIVSRITPLKGHADFIKAVSILNRQIPRLKALVIGSAPKDKYMEDLTLLTRRFGLSKTIEFIGAVDDIPKAMRGLDLLVSATTTQEAFGRSIIEAHASGVPVVATSVGGVMDVVEDERTGLLCAPQNSKEMADKIMKLYQDRSLARALAIEARKRLESRFTMEKMAERTLEVYDETLRRTDILVIKMSAIGDVILAVPSLRAIRAKYPNADIKVLVGSEAREVLNGCPYINGRIVCDLKSRHKGISGLWRLGKELRDHCFDIVIDLQNNKKSRILGALSTAPLRCGYDNGKLSFLLNKSVKDDAPHLDPIEHQFRVLKLAGVKPSDKKLQIWPSESDEAAVRDFLAGNWIKEDQELVGINVRAQAKWVSKNWPAAYIAELCDNLAKEFSIRAVLTGSKSDEDYALQITKLTRSKPVMAVGKTSLMELAVLIKRCSVYLTPDSAPMHIAASVGTPFIALFGPTDPERHAPPAEDRVILSRKQELGCAPCYSPGCSKRYRCMKDITVEEVFESIKGFLHHNTLSPLGERVRVRG